MVQFVVSNHNESQAGKTRKQVNESDELRKCARAPFYETHACIGLGASIVDCILVNRRVTCDKLVAQRKALVSECARHSLGHDSHVAMGRLSGDLKRYFGMVSSPHKT